MAAVEPGLAGAVAVEVPAQELLGLGSAPAGVAEHGLGRGIDVGLEGFGRTHGGSPVRRLAKEAARLGQPQAQLCLQRVGLDGR